MNESDQISETPAESTETPDPVRPAQQRRRQKSVVHYISILFAAAFLLLALTYMMERRQNAEKLDNLNQSLSGLKESVSAMKSVENLQAENIDLQVELETISAQLALLEGKYTLLESDLANQTEVSTLSLQAMDLFWQVDEAYAKDRYGLARQLMAEMEEANLVGYLPKESTTDNGRFSPADRYQEIYDAVN